MAVNKWAYNEDMCEGHYCCGDCDKCSVLRKHDLMDKLRFDIWMERVMEAREARENGEVDEDDE